MAAPTHSGKPGRFTIYDIGVDDIVRTLYWPTGTDLSGCTNPTAPIKLRPQDADGDAVAEFDVTLAPGAYGDNYVLLELPAATVATLPKNRQLYARLTYTLPDGTVDTPVLIDVKVGAA